jgi:tetratricopeptide (TPR) repeat protein
VALHEALYGHRPFRGKSIEDIKQATLSGELPPPAEGRDVPAFLRRVVVRGLSPDPAARHPSMRALLDALEQDRRARRRWSWGLFAAAVLLALAIVAVWSLRPAGPVDDRVEQLVIEARAAAAKIHFVYPPPEDPSTQTAYRVVQQLEALEGPMADAGLRAALELRAEFSSTLVRLGDRYWGEDGGRPFSIDYYLSALVFDPNNERARERAAVTPGELVALRTKAEAGEFTAAELEAAHALVALADDDAERRREKVERIVSATPQRASTTTASLQRVARISAEPVAGDTAAAEAATPPAGATRREAAPAPAPGRDETEPAKSVAAPKVDRDSARAHVERARAAQRSGDMKAAESWFHRALEIDRGQPDALAGLSELYFEQGAYQRALEFARRGVKAAPKSGRHHVILGDCNFKALRYADARAAYETALELGHSSARGRLARLDEMLGAR